MAMKGLPDKYEVLCDVIQTQKVKPTYEEFKSQIKAKEIRLNDTKISPAAKVMSVEERIIHDHSDINTIKHGHSFTKQSRKCYNCFKYGHYASECDISTFCERCCKHGHTEDVCKSTRFCDYCKNYNHLTEYCWFKPKDSINNVSSHLSPAPSTGHSVDHRQVASPTAKPDMVKEAPDIVGAVAAGEHVNSDAGDVAVYKPPHIWHVRHQKNDMVKYLVDSGASNHIITDKNKFISLDCNYNPQQHNLLLADRSNEFGKIQGKGVAKIIICDAVGNPRRITLHDALYVPKFPQNILSAMCLVNNGMQLKMDKTGVHIQDQHKNSYIAECDSNLAYFKVEY